MLHEYEENHVCNLTLQVRNNSDLQVRPQLSPGFWLSDKGHQGMTELSKERMLLAEDQAFSDFR